MLNGSQVEGGEVEVRGPVGTFQGRRHTGCVAVRAESVFGQRAFVARGGESVVGHPGGVVVGREGRGRWLRI